MALSRSAKESAVTELTSLLASSKMTVAARYTGLGVSELQALRAAASEKNTTVRVAKNRLVKVAVAANDSLKDASIDDLSGQLLYAFNEEDEVTPAQVLNDFAKQHPNLEFVGAISEDGEFLDAEKVKHLASLPTKDQLRGQLVSVIAAPVSGFVNVLAGNIRGLAYVLQARAESIQ